MGWNRYPHLHTDHVCNIKMITGFHIQNDTLTWWEKIKNLHAYSWIFRKEQCERGACCMGGGYCLTFTYSK